MMLHSLSQRERALSLWVQDRLHERAAVEWATSALKRIRGPLSAELLNLFAFLEEQAQKSDQLTAHFKTVWHLFRVVAEENTGTERAFEALEIREDLKARKAQPEFAARLVDLVRPRLNVDPPWRLDEPSKEANPIRWVRWEFKNRGGSLNRFEARFSRADLRHLDVPTLVRIVERGTDALNDALAHAEQIGWFDGGVDLATYYVNRVVAPEDAADLVEDSSEDAEQRDPDAYNKNFAPLVRLLSTSFECLLQNNVDAARRVCTRWDSNERGLLLRLAAFARWNREVKTGNEVAVFLLALPERPFWLWSHYPEIATARALRWNDLSTQARKSLERRLAAGPSPEVFGDDANLREGIVEYYRDHELARLIDSGARLSADVVALVTQRRADGSGFPQHIPAVEEGREGVRVVTREAGNAQAFDDVPVEHLLEQLQKAAKEHEFRRGDDTEAFAATLSGKTRILAALERPDARGELADKAWQLLLSYPPRKSDDQEGMRQYVERTAVLALGLEPQKVSALADRLSYWLDAADEVVPDFVGASDLWLRLLPIAAARAQTVGATALRQDDEKTVDLTMAALNEPLGHLLSLFLRKCPSGSPANPPRLPSLYSEPLKKLVGRAGELLANRMAVAMRYFALADREWVNALVVAPMLSELPEGDRVWEAFALYGQIPPPEIWHTIEENAYRRLASARLTPEGRRRIAEMAVVIWAWTKRPAKEYRVNATGLRSALGLGPEDARVQAAWMYLGLFKAGEDAGGEAGDTWITLGPTFFAEVWPLEPALQSASSGNHFAEVPTRVRAEHFEAAVHEILPYVRPFDVWSVKTELGLDIESAASIALIEARPEAVLRLLCASIDDNIRHSVMGLRQVLDMIAKSAPKFERDPKMRALRRVAGE